MADRRLRATTDVLLREQRHAKGTEFAVRAEPKQPTEIDPTTASAWLREGWAEDAPAAVPAKAGK